MSWKTGFTARGSFKGAAFWVQQAELEVGRRVQVHEYPKRDMPLAEDLGRKARKIQIEAYCLGDDYMEERDALVAAVEEAGPGTLRHPYWGTLTVTITSFRVREGTREGGYAAITLQCVESGEQTYPNIATNTQHAVKAAADQSLADAINSFADSFAISDVAGAVDNFLAEVDDVFAAAANVTGSVSGPLADIIRAPAELGAAIAGAVTNIASIAGEPKRTLDIYRNLFSAGDEPIVANNTSRAQQAARNSQALNELVRTSAVIESCRASASLELSPSRQTDVTITRNAVADIREALLDVIDTRQESIDVVSGKPISDMLYASLSDLRKAVAIDLSVRGQRLPVVMVITPGAILPALVLAYQQHGDASRETELVKLNNLRHPGFVPGGQPLEVLSE